jgi:competence ComEA-like helix-hairpin-helix protein
MRRTLSAFLLTLGLMTPLVAWAAGLDLNAATAEELDALPGVGPATAAKILEYRAAHGGFGAVDELDAVSGIGPATLEKIRPLVTVGPKVAGASGAAPVAVGDTADTAGKAGGKASTKSSAATDSPTSSAPPAPAAASGSGCPVNINTADATWLQDLPGVGPAKAAAIVQSRTDAGPFASCGDLDRVSGFGAASLAKIAPCCVVK